VLVDAALGNHDSHRLVASVRKAAPESRVMRVARPSALRFVQQWIGSTSEVTDAEEDCPADLEAPQGLVAQAAGADCPGDNCSAISEDGVRP